MKTQQKKADDNDARFNSLLVNPGSIHYTETVRHNDISEMPEPGLIHLSRKFQELQTANKNLRNQLQYRILECARCNNFMAEMAKKLHVINSSVPFEKVRYRAYIENCVCQLKQYLNQNIWNEFKLRFAEIHTDFYDKLVIKYPTLTVNDLRLCAFIKLKMSTKEIATVLNKPVNSIKVARKRLREKLHIENSSETLISFLATY